MTEEELWRAVLLWAKRNSGVNKPTNQWTEEDNNKIREVIGVMMLNTCIMKLSFNAWLLFAQLWYIVWFRKVVKRKALVIKGKQTSGMHSPNEKLLPYKILQTNKKCKKL